MKRRELGGGNNTKVRAPSISSERTVTHAHHALSFSLSAPKSARPPTRPLLCFFKYLTFFCVLLVNPKISGSQKHSLASGGGKW